MRALEVYKGKELGESCAESKVSQKALYYISKHAFYNPDTSWGQYNLVSLCGYNNIRAHKSEQSLSLILLSKQ